VTKDVDERVGDVIDLEPRAWTRKKPLPLDDDAGDLCATQPVLALTLARPSATRRTPP
jgi:hypothetical protein